MAWSAARFMLSAATANSSPMPWKTRCISAQDGDALSVLCRATHGSVPGPHLSSCSPAACEPGCSRFAQQQQVQAGRQAGRQSKSGAHVLAELGEHKVALVACTFEAAPQALEGCLAPLGGHSAGSAHAVLMLLALLLVHDVVGVIG